MACAVGIAIVAARRVRTVRLARVLGVFRTLSDSPGRAVRLFGWLGVATVARLVAAIAIAASLGIPNPVEAGVVMCAVVIVATALPLMPGNVGVTSGAIVLALHAQGVPVVSALAAGLVFHAVELLAGIVFGLAGTLALVPYPSLLCAVGAWPSRGYSAPHCSQPAWAQPSCLSSPDRELVDFREAGLRDSRWQRPTGLCVRLACGLCGGCERVG